MKKEGTTKVVLIDPISPMTTEEAEGLEDFIEQTYPQYQCAILHPEYTGANMCVHLKRRNG